MIRRFLSSFIQITRWNIVIARYLRPIAACNIYQPIIAYNGKVKARKTFSKEYSRQGDGQNRANRAVHMTEIISNELSISPLTLSLSTRSAAKIKARLNHGRTWANRHQPNSHQDYNFPAGNKSAAQHITEWGIVTSMSLLIDVYRQSTPWISSHELIPLINRVILFLESEQFRDI